MVALNVGSMPGPAPPQFPGHSLPSSSLKGWGARSQEAHHGCVHCYDHLAPSVTRTGPGPLQPGLGQHGTEGAAWDRGGSVGQRGQRGTEGTAWGRGMCPRRPRLWQSHSADPLCMSLQPLGKERSGEGREKHGAVCRALDEKAPLAPGLLCCQSAVSPCPLLAGRPHLRALVISESSPDQKWDGL